MASSITSEAWLLDAARPAEEFTVVRPRRQGVEYHVEHQAYADGTGRLLILHNDQAENFELAAAPLSDPAYWTPIITPRDDTRLLSVDAFVSDLVVYFRRDGLTGLRVIGQDGSGSDGALDDAGTRSASASRSTASPRGPTASTEPGCSASATVRW